MPKKVKSTRKTFPTKIKVYPLDYKGLLNDPNRKNKDEYEVKENLKHNNFNVAQSGPFGGYNHYELYHEENVKNLVERSGFKESFAKVVGQYNKNVEDETKLLQYVEDLKEDLASYKGSNKLLKEKIDSKDFSSNVEAFKVNKIAGDTPKTSIKFITDMLVRYDSLKPKEPNTTWYGDYNAHKDKLTFPIPDGPKDDNGRNKNLNTLHSSGYHTHDGQYWYFEGYNSATNVNAYLAFDNLVDELLKNDKGIKESVDKTHQELVPLKDELLQEMTSHDNLILGYKDRKFIIPQPKLDDDNISVININEQRNINDDLLSKYGDNKSVLDLKEALTNKAQPKLTLTQQQYLDVSASRLKDETQQQSAIDFSVIQQQNIEDKKQDQSVNAIRDLKSALDSTRYIALFDAANRLKHAKKVYKSRPVVYQYTAPSRIKPKELDLRARFNLMID